MFCLAPHPSDAGRGVMVRGSHNPPEYNGLKMMVAGDTLSGEAIQDLRRLIESEDFVSPAQAGAQSHADIAQAYTDRLTSAVKLARPITISVDSCNSAPRPSPPTPFL